MWEKILSKLHEQHRTVASLAKETGISYNFFMSLQRGDSTNPSFRTMCRVADALGVSLDYFRTDRKKWFKCFGG